MASPLALPLNLSISASTEAPETQLSLKITSTGLYHAKIKCMNEALRIIKEIAADIVALESMKVEIPSTTHVIAVEIGDAVSFYHVGQLLDVPVMGGPCLDAYCFRVAKDKA